MKERKGKYRRDRCECCRKSRSKRKAPKYLIKKVLHNKYIGGRIPLHVSEIKWMYSNEFKMDCLPSECLHGLSKWKSKLYRHKYINKHFQFY